MKLVRILLNKYLLTTLAFLLLMLFFDQNDWISQKARKKDLKEVNDNINYLNREIGRMDTEYAAIRTDPKALEKYAREHYRMKKDSEDLYIIEQK